MGIAATLLPSQLRLNRLRTALRERYALASCATWEALLAQCGASAVALAVVDLAATGETSAGFDALRRLKHSFPSVTVVVYGAVPPLGARDLFEAGRFGVDGLILAEQDDEPRQMLAIVEQAEARGVTARLRTALRGARPTARDAVLVAVTRAHQRISPAALARVLGLRPRTLAERLNQAGFPPAQRLIAWGRLTVAARMLEDVERSADSVAMALDYPSGSAFRNSCQRYVRMTPQQIRAAGGASAVIAALLAEIALPPHHAAPLSPTARLP